MSSATADRSFFTTAREVVGAWLPDSTRDRRVRVLAWLTLVVQIGIVGTGGAVRLTGSGLGCPTWPECTPGSLVATPEMGVHGAIEFGNRLLTFVLVVVAIATFVSVLRMRRARRELFVLTLLIGLGIPAQAVIGGISVLTNLNPWVVGFHFVVSAAMVALSAVYVFRVVVGARGERGVPAGFAGIAHLASLAVAVTVLVGIVTTGSGPHAGDEGSARNGLDPEFLQHVHSWPAYASAALVLALVVGSLRLERALPRRFSFALLGAIVLQIAVGLWQARTGLPVLLVGTHMVLAVTTVAVLAGLLCSLRTARPASGVDAPVGARSAIAAEDVAPATP